MGRISDIIAVTALIAALAAVPAAAVEPWRTDFNEACGKADEAMTLSLQELKALVEKCNRVVKALAAEDESVRKVFLKRVQMCRNLYVFMVETKEQQPKK
jgi:sialic acid synthase SpsE